MKSIERRIESMARSVLADNASIGVLSVGEQIAVALLLGRMDLLPKGFEHPLGAIERLGDAWLGSVLALHKADWKSR
jgi:hypothetical protein